MSKYQLIHDLAIVLNLYAIYTLLFKKKKVDMVSRKSLAHLRTSIEKKQKISLDRFGNSSYIKSVKHLIDAQNFKLPFVEDLFVVVLLMSFILVWNITTDLNVFMRFLYTVVLGNIPCLVLLLRLKKVQAIGSLESEAFLTEFNANYRFTTDFITALDTTIINSTHIDILRKPLLRLSMSLKEYKTDAELQSVLEYFNKTIGTNWAKTYTAMIYSAVQLGQDQSYAIDSLLKDLEYGRKVHENYKQLNSDIIIMVKALIPIMYIISVYAFFNMLDFTLADYIKGQFLDPTGRQLFLGIVAAECVNILILYFIEHKKLDSIK